MNQLVLVVFFVFAALPSTPLLAQASEDPAPALYGVVVVGAVADDPAFALGGNLTFAWPVGGWIGPEIAGGFGWAPGRQDSAFWLRLGAGVRVEPSLSAVTRAFAALRVVHQHFAAGHVWSHHPLESAAGDAREGLGHRTGLALGGGVTWDVPGTNARLRTNLSSELLWVFLGEGPAWFPSMELGVGWVFS